MAVPMTVGMIPFLKKEVDLLPIALQDQVIGVVARAVEPDQLIKLGCSVEIGGWKDGDSLVNFHNFWRRKPPSFSGWRKSLAPFEFRTSVL